MFQSTGEFNIVILYDDLTSIGRAMAAYSHLTRELGDEFTPELRIWRIDVAASREYAAQADDEIETAEMIILAVRGSQPCPVAFRRWTERVRDGCGPPNPALIAIIEGADEPATSIGTWSSILRGTAAQMHPDIFLWAPHVAAGSP